MNAPLRKSLAAMLLIALAAPSYADDSDKERDDAPTYSAIRITQAKADFSNLDPAINLGFTLGINIPPLSPYAAVELDLSQTIIPGENSGAGSVTSCDGGDNGGGGLGGGLIGGGGGGDQNCRTTRSGDDLQLFTVGLFFTGRSGGDFYGLARAGYRYIQSTVPEFDDNASGSAWGFGAGYRYGPKSSVELVYNQYGSDLRLISLVVNY